MKLSQKLVVTLTFVLGLGGFMGISTGQVGAQTQKQATNCYNTWNGKASGTGTKNNLNITKFKKSDCAGRNGGNCTLETSSAGAKVSCTKKPSADDSDAAIASGCGKNGNAETCTDPALSTACTNGTANKCNVLSKIINPLIATLSVLVGIAVVIGIIWGAIQISTSAGDPQKNASGRRHITNAVIALVAYILFFAFMRWIIPGGVS